MPAYRRLGRIAADLRQAVGRVLPDDPIAIQQEVPVFGGDEARPDAAEGVIGVQGAGVGRTSSMRQAAGADICSTTAIPRSPWTRAA
jgi:hypothetical protein